MTKVRFEAFLWGAGTALGELPPYFMAKAARLSGSIYDDEDVFEDKEKSKNSGDESSSIMEKGKAFMEKVVEKIGFFGILACASVSLFVSFLCYCNLYDSLHRSQILFSIWLELLADTF